MQLPHRFQIAGFFYARLEREMGSLKKLIDLLPKRIRLHLLYHLHIDIETAINEWYGITENGFSPYEMEEMMVYPFISHNYLNY